MLAVPARVVQLNIELSVSDVLTPLAWYVTKRKKALIIKALSRVK